MIGTLIGGTFKALLISRCAITISLLAWHTASIGSFNGFSLTLSAVVIAA
jgi:hypothetical protein